MANSSGTSGATIVELLGDGGNPIELSKATGAAIEKGDLLVLNDLRTASGPDSASAALVFAGIATMDATAAEAKDNISVYTYGIFDMYCASAVTTGDLVCISGGNLIGKISRSNLTTHAGTVVGKALEDGSVGEQIEVLVGGL